MIVVSVTYPAGCRFDLDYYMQTHIPLVRSRWADFGLSELRVFGGVAAAGGGTPPVQITALVTFGS